LANAAHPWRTGLIQGLWLTPIPLVIFWSDSTLVAIGLAVVTVFVTAIVHALSWLPQGPSRLRFARRYGIPREWPEHRWLAENSNWPF
jgi:hypothetical protein